MKVFNNGQKYTLNLLKPLLCQHPLIEPCWNVMAHGDAREGKWRGNWRMEWVASTLHTTTEHGVSSITTADAHTSAASSRLNWRPCRFKWTRPFRRKTKSGFCACAITFQTQSTSQWLHSLDTNSRYDVYLTLQKHCVTRSVSFGCSASHYHLYIIFADDCRCDRHFWNLSVSLLNISLK